MGTFSTVFESIERFGEEFDQNQAKLNLIVEYEMNNYDITQRQTALDLGTEESMVLEDALNVIEEASNRTVEKINKARQAGDNESKVYYNKIIQSLKKLNANGDPSDFNDIIRVSQQACKTYPALGKKEMTYDDYSGEVAVLQRAKTEANKMLTKAKRGKITKADGSQPLVLCGCVAAWVRSGLSFSAAAFCFALRLYDYGMAIRQRRGPAGGIPLRLAVSTRAFSIQPSLLRFRCAFGAAAAWSYHPVRLYCRSGTGRTARPLS